MYTLGDIEKKDLKSLVAMYIRELNEEERIKKMTVWQDSYDRPTQRHTEENGDIWSVISFYR